MKLKLVLSLMFIGVVSTLTAQALPAVNILTVNGVTCTFTVIDGNASVSTDCLLVSDGTILARSVNAPQTKGTLLGTGPILCLLSKTAATPPVVNFECSTDDDTAVGPKVALKGTLAGVSKTRQWWIFWR